MFGLGTGELAIILVIVLVIFGAGKLPQVGAALGKGVRGFKENLNGDAEVVEKVVERTDASEKRPA